MINIVECCICGELLNLKSEEVAYLDDMPCHEECYWQERKKYEETD